MLIGNVGADPFVRYIDYAGQNDARKVAQFNLATTERYKDRSGESKENTEWHSVVIWGRTADFVENYVKKGAQLYVEGRLRTREFTDKNGIKKRVTEILADTVQMLSGRSGGDEGQEEPRRPQPSSRPAAKTTPRNDTVTVDVDEDLPF